MVMGDWSSFVWVDISTLDMLATLSNSLHLLSNDVTNGTEWLAVSGSARVDCILLAVFKWEQRLLAAHVRGLPIIVVISEKKINVMLFVF